MSSYYVGDATKIEGYLKHYGVPGQSWGKRRYQNPDGSLTAEGRAHYGVGDPRGKGGFNWKRAAGIGLGAAAAAGAGYLAYRKLGGAKGVANLASRFGKTVRRKATGARVDAALLGQKIGDSRFGKAVRRKVTGARVNAALLGQKIGDSGFSKAVRRKVTGARVDARLLGMYAGDKAKAYAKTLGKTDEGVRREALGYSKWRYGALVGAGVGLGVGAGAGALAQRKYMNSKRKRRS